LLLEVVGNLIRRIDESFVFHQMDPYAALAKAFKVLK